MIDPRDLLRKLGGCVRPAGVRADRRGEAFESMRFTALLDEVAGGARTGRPITVEARARVEMTETLREAVGAVADACEAAGLSGVVVIDGEGRALEVDVDGRRVVGSAGDARGLILRGAEAVVVLGGVLSGAPRVVDAQELHGTLDAGELRPGDGLRVVRNASLAAVLGERSEGMPGLSPAGG